MAVTDLTTYGVTPSGFARKPFAQILADLEAALAAPSRFGPGVIQTPESPLGQINGALAEAISSLWELAEATYASIDPDQAEGARLDILARLRLLERADGEADATLRADVTNAGRARIDMSDMIRAIKAITGVTYAVAWVNDGDTTDANGVPPHSVSVAAMGGDDAAIASAIRAYVVPGVGSYGNTRVDVTIDGFCRALWFVRPAPVRVRLSLTVATQNDRNGCPPPSAVAMKTALVEELAASLRNGDDVTLHRLNVALSCRFQNVEITAAQAARGDATLASLPLAIGFDEIATIAATDIAIATP